MITTSKKFIALTILCLVATVQTSYANDIQRQQLMSRQQVVNLQPVAKSAEETYTPIAFAAGFDGGIDKNVYQDKAGEIVVGRLYVPENY